MSVYFQKALEKSPRLLSLQDRDDFSITSGCFDRNYWQWKFVDFSCPVLQQGVFALSFLYSEQGSDYYQSKKLKKWIVSGLNFWMKRQHKDGSFDEAYPHEHSLAATAVSSFYVAESLNTIDVEIKDKVIKSLKKAGNWLLKNDETHGFLSNHIASAAAALFHIYLLTGEEKYKERANYFVNKIKKHQSEEGWFEEYGGADPGYQTLAVFYLARYWQLSGDLEVLEMLRKSMDFLIYCIHPNATLGGEYASRNTEFFFPAGFEMLAEKIEKAAVISARMKKAKTKSLDTIDLYNFILMFNNYLFAQKNEKDIIVQDNFFSAEFSKFFKEAGIFFKNTLKYYCIVSTTKGGVVKVYDRERLRYGNAGWIGRLPNGWTVTSQWQVKDREVEVQDNRLLVRGNFYKRPQKIFSPRLFIMFRLFMAFAGLFKPFRYFIKNVIVRVLIKEENKIKVNFEREIVFEDSSIVLKDKLLNKGVWFDSLNVSDKFSSIHMGSSKYFYLQELENDAPDSKDFSEEINSKKEIFYEDKRNY
jgi:hypothetical protein